SGGVVLQPEKYEPHDRNQEIAVKNDAGVPRGEIVRRDHLIDVTAGRAPEEAGGPDDGREPQIEASPERQQSHHGKAEAREPTSNWKGLSSHPMKPAASFPKKTCKTKLKSAENPIENSTKYDNNASTISAKMRSARARQSALAEPSRPTTKNARSTVPEKDSNI